MEQEREEFDTENEELIEFVQNDNHSFETLWQGEQALDSLTNTVFNKSATGILSRLARTEQAVKMMSNYNEMSKLNLKKQE